MQSVNGATFLNNIFLLAIFIAAPSAAAFGTVIVDLTSMYAIACMYAISLLSHTFDLIVDVLNLMLLLSYLPFCL